MGSSKPSSAAKAAAIVAVFALASASTLLADKRPEQVTGASPFEDCTADGVPFQPDTVTPASEVEPWMVVNPTDKDNIVGTWQQDRWGLGGARGLAVAASDDAGKTWEIVPLPNLTLCTGGEFLRASDPWLSFAPNGDLFHMSLAFDPRIDRDAMLVQRSIDGGHTWSDPVALIDEAGPFVNDKNTLTADPFDPDFVYATWDRLDLLNGGGPAVFTRSTDGGATFEPVRVIQDPGPMGQTIGNQIVVLPDGTLVDFFLELELISFDPFIARLELSLKRSPDKGDTWLPDGPSIVVAQYGSIFDVFEPEQGTPVRTASALFDVAVNRTDGTLYVVWQDARFNGFQHEAIAMTMSTDGGFTWSAPVQINQTPEDIPLANRQAFVPSVHVNDKGRVAVTYYDFRNDGKEPASLTDYWAITCNPKKDCGDPGSWSGEIRLSGKSFDILDAPVVAAGLFLGDYAGLTSAKNEFLAFFSMPHRGDSASVFLRRFDDGPERREAAGGGPANRGPAADSTMTPERILPVASPLTRH